VGAAIEVTLGFYTMTDYLDATIFARRSEGVDRTLEAIKSMRVSIGHTYLKSLVVLISTDFALSHIQLLLPDWSDFPFLK
jgi:hypothetical protein